MKIKKLKEKEQTQEVKFDAKSLEKNKDDKASFKTSVDDQENVEKEFKKSINKIEKFESFITVNIDNVENIGIDNEKDFSADYEDSETSGCGCCDNCTGEEGCYCGCSNCKCGSDETVKKASDFVNTILSESLKYHLDNNKPITENIFRPGSEAFFNVIKEARELFDNGKIKLCDIDKELYESTEIGKFGWFNSELVPLDLPIENIIELNEAEYKGKKVKLNYPMRNTGSGKKYYVYVKNPKTDKVKKVSFGDVKGGLTSKVNDPEARKSFVARHRCKRKWKPEDKLSAGYWSCHLPRYKHLVNSTYSGYW